MYMVEHLRMCTKHSIECPFSAIGCDNERGQKYSILSHLNNELLPHSQLLIEWIFTLKNEIDTMKNKFANCKLKNRKFERKEKPL